MILFCLFFYFSCFSASFALVTTKYYLRFAKNKLLFGFGFQVP